MKILAYFCIREVDRIGLRVRKQLYAVRPLDGGGKQLASSEEQLA